jgi:hypothetical protein
MTSFGISKREQKICFIPSTRPLERFSCKTFGYSNQCHCLGHLRWTDSHDMRTIEGGLGRSFMVLCLNLTEICRSLTRIASISCCLYKACAAAKKIGVHAKESIESWSPKKKEAEILRLRNQVHSLKRESISCFITTKNNVASYKGGDIIYCIFI